MSNNETDISFEVEKDDLAGAVAAVARNLPSKPTQPVLRAMLISADEDGLEFSGFDYEVSTKVRVSADVHNFGSVAVAGKPFAEITSNLPKKPVRVFVDGTMLKLECGNTNYELPSIPLDDYPSLPVLPQVTGAVNPGLLMEAVSQVSVAAGRDDALPMLTGIDMEIDGENVTLTATDRFRLAQRHFSWTPAFPTATAKLLVPARNLLDNVRALDQNSPDPVEIAVGGDDAIGAEGLFGIHVGSVQTTTRMLDADFPNVEPLLPKSHTSLASVEVAPLLEAIRRVALVTDRNAQIRLTFRRDELFLSAGGEEAGHAEELIPCEYTSDEEFLIAFNPAYLRDGLGAVHTEKVVFGFTEPSRPAILIPGVSELPDASEDGTFPSPETYFTYLLMPVRLPG